MSQNLYFVGTDPELKEWEDLFLESSVPPHCAPMNIAQSGLLLQLLMFEAQQLPKPEQEQALRNQLHGGLFRVLEHRLEYLGVEATFPAKLFLWNLSEGSPGNVSILAHGVRAIQGATGKTVTLKCLAEVFQVGFPTADRMQFLWDAQKRVGAPLGNMLDGVVMSVSPKEGV